MKLTDIDENLAEAQPAGILARMGTKLKKHTPFNKAARDRAAGEEITQQAANEVAGAFNTWLGKAKASGVNPKALTVANLMDFFQEEGYAKTAERVIKAAAEKKAPKQVEQPSEDEPKAGTDYTDQANAQLAKNKKKGPSQNVPGYGQVNINTESLEARLAAMLTEAGEEQEVTFNPKEVNKLIMQIIGTVHKEKPKALATKIEKDDTEASTTDTSTISDEDIARIKQRLDKFGDDLENTLRSKIEDKGLEKDVIGGVRGLIADIADDIY